MASSTDLERIFYGSALGLTEAQMASISFADLERRYFASYLGMTEAQIAASSTAQLRAAYVANPPGAVDTVHDSFTRANAAALGVANTGQAWQTDGVSGWGIDTNRMAWTGASDSFAYIDSGLSDNFFVEFVANSVTGLFPLAIVPRYTSPASYIKIFRVQSEDKWKLNVSGVVTLGNTSPDIVNGDTVKVEVKGTSYVLRVNGVALDLFNTSALSGVTQHGVGGSGGTALYVDEFSVGSLT